MLEKGYINKYIPSFVKIALEVAVESHKCEIEIFDAVKTAIIQSGDFEKIKGIAERKRDFVLGLQNLKEEQEEKEKEDFQKRLDSLPKIIKINKGKEKPKKNKFTTRNKIKLERMKIEVK